jgi:predicted DNA-binding transcriptional regulator AlpA
VSAAKKDAATRLRWRDFDDDDLVDDITAEQLTGISRHTFRWWRREGKGGEPAGPRYSRLGKHCRYQIRSLKQWIARNEVATSDDPGGPQLRKVS